MIVRSKITDESSMDIVRGETYVVLTLSIENAGFEVRVMKEEWFDNRGDDEYLSFPLYSLNNFDVLNYDVPSVWASENGSKNQSMELAPKRWLDSDIWTHSFWETFYDPEEYDSEEADRCKTIFWQDVEKIFGDRGIQN